MKATLENMVIEPGQFKHSFQTCDWFFNGKNAFHHRTYTPRMRPMTDEYWLDGWQHSAAELKEAISAHGLDPEKYECRPEYYGEGFFPVAFTVTDALAYFNAVNLIAACSNHNIT
jgi:hypothetical protein